MGGDGVMTTALAASSASGAHAHPAWWAFVVHRVSGVALALFLPVHFWALGTALDGADALQRFLRFAEMPLVRVAEWGLVVLLSMHLMGGLRLLLIEFGPWTGLRKNWIAAGTGVAACVGLVYALALWR